MGKFGKALLGGIAGMAGAAGEIFDDQIKSKEDDRKAAILEKREKTLAMFRHELNMESQDRQFAQQDKTALTSRTNKELDQPSGKVLDGMPLSRLQFDQLSDEDKGRTISIQGYKEGEKASAWEDKKQELDYRQADDLELAHVRGSYASHAKPEKVSVAEKKLAKENAQAGIQSVIAPFNGQYIKELGEYQLDIEGKSQAELDAIFKYIDSKGFQFNARKDADGKGLVISLGEFDYDKYISPKPIYEEVDQDNQKKTDIYDEFFKSLNKNTPGSKMNGQLGAFSLKSSHGIAAPIQ